MTESRLVYSRISRWSPQSPPAGLPEFEISVRKISLPSGELEFGGSQNNSQFFQNANRVWGRHDLKFGGQYLQLRDNRAPRATTKRPSPNRGVFADVQGFVDGVLSSFQLAGGPSKNKHHYRYNDFAFFLQDTWKIAPRITRFAGVAIRIFRCAAQPGREKEMDANFYYGPGANIFERIANGSVLPTADAPGEYRNHFYLPDCTNFAPRLGLALDLTGEGRTVCARAAASSMTGSRASEVWRPTRRGHGLARLFRGAG